MTARHMQILSRNHGAEPYGTFRPFSASYTPAGFLASNLKTAEPTETTRITSYDPQHSQVYLTTAYVPITVDGMAIINHNFMDGTQYRFVGNISAATGTYHTYSKSAPNSLFYSSNVTGGVTDIDEDASTPDGLFMTPTNPSLSWTIITDFPSFTGDLPRIGSDISKQYAALVLNVQRVNVGAVTELLTAPYVTVTLMEGTSVATPIRTLGVRAISTVGENQMLVFPFDFKELTNTDGSNIRIQLEFTKGFYDTGGYAYLKLDTMNIYYDPASTVYTWDSDWITIDNSTELNASLAPTKSTHYFPATPWGPIGSGANTSNVILLIRGDMLDHFPSISDYSEALISTYKPGFYEMGVVSIAEGIDLSVGQLAADSAPGVRINVEDVSGYTLGGQSYGASAWRRRELSPTEITCTQEEVARIQDLRWKLGNSSPVYITLDPDLAYEYQNFNSFYGVFTELGEPRRIPGTDMFRIMVGFTEKL